MRLTMPNYNPVKECSGCLLRDEKMISAHILSYQFAARLLLRYPGSWQLRRGEIVLRLEELTHPVTLDLLHGTVQYGSLVTHLSARYESTKGIDTVTQEICKDLGLPESSEGRGTPDKTFNLFVKLIEVFHARCGLQILPLDEGKKGWELCLCENGPSGWLNNNGIAENRFGETMDISQWDGLRPEKVATYLFGFNRFCGNFSTPQIQQ